jgi:dTDP-4-amino-4,6-dideoxygalactose transaminase
LLPYLRRIDAARVYSNYGPLVLELESRQSEAFGLVEGSVTTASSGTAALTGAILAHAGPATAERPLALLPSYTYVATATAVERCGYTPHFLDVDPRTWMLDPADVERHPLLDRAGVVVPVAPYGRLVEQEPWAGLQTRTGARVVIDGAACFEALSGEGDSGVGPIPVALSFHATKAFGTGEGGCVVCLDPQRVLRVAQSLNFGYLTARDSEGPSLNGKMSEYHAAVGLAGLDAWTDTQADLARRVEHYRSAAQAAGLADRFVLAPDVASSYVLFRCHSGDEAQRVRAQLDAGNIDHRLWYGAGVVGNQWYAAAAADPTPHADGFAGLVLGLPMAPDLTDDDIARVVSALATATEPA